MINEHEHPGRRVAILLPLWAQLAFSSVAVAQAPPPAQQARAPAKLDDPLLAPVEPAPRQLSSWREAVALINSRSVDLGIAVQEVERARGSARQALALALPTITASGSLTAQLLTATSPPGTESPANPSLQGQLTVSQPILAPRTWYSLKTAKLGVASAKLSVADKKRTVLTGVVNGIVSVVIAERVAEINRTSLRSALDRLSLTRRQAALGTATRLDVLRVEQDTAATRATLVSGDESLRQARESLGLALGASKAYGVSPSISLVEVEKSMREICAKKTVEDRSDIRQAMNDAEVAARGITDAWLAFSPTATLSTTAGAANQTSAVSGGAGTWSVQALLTVPLWDGGARYGSQRIAHAAAKESKLRLESALRVATIGVAQALRSVLVAEQSRVVSESLRDLAREIARLSQRSFEMGTGTSFDLVDTAQKARAAEVDLAVKEFTVVQAKLNALLALSTCDY
jgi:outer membrane protein, multidrug efflux system